MFLFVFFSFSIFEKCYSVHFTSASKVSYEWYQLLNVGQSIYRDDDEPTPYNKICRDCVDESILNFVLKMSVYVMCFIGICIGPIYNLFIDETDATLYYIRIPFSSEDQNGAHFINTAWQTFICLFGFWGVLIMESMISLANNGIIMSAKLNAFELNHLTDEMESGQTTDNQTRQKLKDIFTKIEYINE